MLIYKITNTITGDFYIGKTSKTKEQRFKKHIYNASYGIDTYLYRAIRKYGKDNFIIEEVENQLNNLSIDKREKFWIDNLNPKYNMTKGGEGGDTSKSLKFIESVKAYHSKRTPESYATYGMLGKKFPEEAKKKVSKANSYSVEIDGIIYQSIKEAQEKLNVSQKTVRYRIDSSNYPNWNRLRDKRKFS